MAGRTKKSSVKQTGINMAETIRELAESKGISEDMVKQIIVSSVKAAYKKEHGTDKNCIVKFADDNSSLTVYSRKVIVDGVYDPVEEIELEDALKLSSDCEVGDEIDILIDPKTFGRYAITQGKQRTHQDLNEGFRENLYNEYKNKVGEVIIGYVQREYKDNIIVDLGRENTVEGVLPKKYQSIREVYEIGDRIKSLIVDIKRSNTGIQLILSRTDAKLVQDFLEAEITELADKTIEIKNIVREAGYRTKVAVYSNNDDVEPIGACVGKNGMRIQNVKQQLEGENIDVVRYDEDPHVYIANALSPATVSRVYILDSAKREALAVVDEEQLSLAIGKQGQNVRLANKLCNWTIDVKTEEQVKDLDLRDSSEAEALRSAENLFSNVSDEENNAADSDENVEEITSVSQLPGVDIRVVGILMDAGLDEFDAFFEAVDNGSILNIEGITQADVDAINEIVSQYEEDGEEEASEEVYEEELKCPECGAVVTTDMTECPKCGTGLVFEEE